MPKRAIHKLSTIVLRLEQEAFSFDKRYAPLTKATFDGWLFKQRHLRLVDYTAEIKANVHELEKLYASERKERSLVTPEAEHLLEIIENQIAAVVKLMHQPDTGDAKGAQIGRTEEQYDGGLSALYNELHQLKVWESRLRTMVAQKRKQFAMERTQSSEASLLATEQRLARCQAAVAKLVKQIPDLELNQPNPDLQNH